MGNIDNTYFDNISWGDITHKPLPREMTEPKGDSSKKFDIGDIPAGTYQVQASHINIKPYKKHEGAFNYTVSFSIRDAGALTNRIIFIEFPFKHPSKVFEEKGRQLLGAFSKAATGRFVEKIEDLKNKNVMMTVSLEKGKLKNEADPSEGYWNDRHIAKAFYSTDDFKAEAEVPLPKPKAKVEPKDRDEEIQF